jgi:hypothetical protein
VLTFSADHWKKERSRELSTVFLVLWHLSLLESTAPPPSLPCDRLAGSISALYTAKYYLKFREFVGKIFTEC